MEQKKEHFLKEIVKFTLIAFVIVVVIRTYIAQPFIVRGASMDYTFASGQYLIVDQLTYHFEEPKRGDVVVFRYPQSPETFFIKRVIGLPNETVTIKNGIVTISSEKDPTGTVYPNTHVSEDNKSYDNSVVTLGSTEYFVMGDNRAESSDSRIWGPLERKYVVGKPFIRLYPLNKISLFPGN